MKSTILFTIFWAHRISVIPVIPLSLRQLYEFDELPVYIRSYQFFNSVGSLYAITHDTHPILKKSPYPRTYVVI